MGVALGAQVVQVDLAGIGGLDDHDAHPGHHRRCGVRTMGRTGDEADVAGLLTAAAVVAADREQTGELSLRTGVRLDRHRRVSRDVREPGLQRAHQFDHPRGVLGGDERMQVGETGPADRLHLGRRVQLHGAAAERDHAAVERVVAIAEPAQVAQHLRLAAVLGEDRVGEDLVLAQPRGVQRRRGVVRQVRGAEGGQDGRQVRVRRGLGHRDPDPVRVEGPQVDPGLARGTDDGLGATGDDRGDRVEEPIGREVDPGIAQPRRQPTCAGVDVLRDDLEPLRTVVDGVHGRDDGEQDLRGADVRGRLLAADVLFAGLQGEPVGGAAGRVDRDADQPTGQVTFEAGAHRHEPGVGAAVEHRHAETLGRPDDDVGAEAAGRAQQHLGQRVGHHHGEGSPVVCRDDDGLGVDDGAVSPLVGHDHAGEVTGRQALAQVGLDERQTDGLGAGVEDGERLGQEAGVHHDGKVRPLAVGAPHERERLGRGGALVEQRGVGRRQAHEVLDHRLEREQRLEPALGDLGLVGRVRRVPGRVLQHVAADHGGRDRRVVAEPDHRDPREVPVGQLAQAGGRLRLGDRVRQAGQGRPDPGGDGRLHERIEGVMTEPLEHRSLVGLARADVAVGEAGGGTAIGHGDNSVGCDV